MKKESFGLRGGGGKGLETEVALSVVTSGTGFLPLLIMG